MPISPAAYFIKLVIAYFSKQGCAAIIREPIVRSLANAVAYDAGAVEGLGGWDAIKFTVQGNKVAVPFVVSGLVLGATGCV